ncbi:MAG: formylglycine-generating enzyme family protein [bacterium]
MKRWPMVIFILLILTLHFPMYGHALSFPNSINMKMLYIEGGEFIMGDQGSQGGFDEKPAHAATISPFYLSETTITVAQWRQFYEDSDTAWDLWDSVKKYSPDKESPIIFISYNDAIEFCAWLSEKEGRNYRLPTEAEWEFAARGGSTGKEYPWGDTPPDGTQCNFADMDEYEKDKDLWAAEATVSDGYAYCAKVHAYTPNGYGLYQMSGNVLQWCQDWYFSHYYHEAPSDNPKGPESGNEKVLRGGAWCFPPVMVRVSDRYNLNPSIRKEFIGFRIAIDRFNK